MLILIIGSAAVAGAILLLAASSPPITVEPFDDWPDQSDRLMQDMALFTEAPKLTDSSYSVFDFLILYVHAFALFVARYRQLARSIVQTALFSIRQILMTTLFGRGLLHG
ncbi:hypothetical protein [Fibrella aestuarina]|nr:hypothetical protein [Fibrella aestuarina]